MRSAQRKGDMATAQAVATFTALGFDVLLPLTESAPYDLVVDDGERLSRVQCKFTSHREVDLRRIHSNGQGFVVKSVTAGAYDWLYVLRADGGEFLLQECHHGRRSVIPQERHRIVRRTLRQ